MDMVELKRVEKPKKEAETSLSEYPQDEYPVSLWLENDQLDQLGVKNLDVGDEMTVMAKVRVRSFSASDTTQGPRKSANLAGHEHGSCRPSKVCGSDFVRWQR